MKCKKCGTEFKEGIFCPECGLRFDDGNLQHNEPESLIYEKSEQAGLEQRNSESENKNIQTEKSIVASDNSNKKQKTKNTLGLIALVFGILGALTSVIIVGIIPDIIGGTIGVIALTGKGKPKKAAIAGLVLSIIGIAIFSFIFAIV